MELDHAEINNDNEEDPAALHSRIEHVRVAQQFIELISQATLDNTKLDDSTRDQDARNGLIAATHRLTDCLNVGDDAFLLPGMQRTRATHAAHHLIQNKQCAVTIADFADGLEIARHGSDTACSGPHHRLCTKRNDFVGPKPLELILQFTGKPRRILRA